MVFRRRNRRPLLQTMQELIYPRGGWYRAVQYIRHRVNRLPDSPERIARGIFAGVFTVFSPFYGLHFVLAFLVAKLMRGNVFAALVATFLGNPLTYLPIAWVSLRTGYWLTRDQYFHESSRSIRRSFSEASQDLWFNFRALFTPHYMEWDRLIDFFQHVFYPFLVGGILPGLLAGLIAYYLSVPVIRSYQKLRTRRLTKKLRQRRKIAKRMADEAADVD